MVLRIDNCANFSGLAGQRCCENGAAGTPVLPNFVLNAFGTCLFSCGSDDEQILLLYSLDVHFVQARVCL